LLFPFCALFTTRTPLNFFAAFFALRGLVTAMAISPTAPE
jgi:hypothetical protein